MKKGDIVLLPFPFSDLSGFKKRPAVILINSREDITVSFITSQFSNFEELDLILNPTNSNNLKKTSLLKLNKISTIDKELVIGRIGSLDSPDLKKMNNNLIKILKLSL